MSIPIGLPQKLTTSLAPDCDDDDDQPFVIREDLDQDQEEEKGEGGVEAAADPVGDDFVEDEEAKETTEKEVAEKDKIIDQEVFPPLTRQGDDIIKEIKIAEETYETPAEPGAVTIFFS